MPHPRSLTQSPLTRVLPNGREVTYCERGENNPEVLITGAFYFHTFMPVVEYLMELDCPKRVAEEAFSFINEVKQS